MTQCFWCEMPLSHDIANRPTRDHLVSKPLAKFLKIERPESDDWIVTSCRSCNSKRATISGCLGHWIVFGAKTSRRSPFWKGHRKMLKFVHRFRKLVLLKLKEERQKMCLHELDEVLSMKRKSPKEKANVDLQNVDYE